MKESLKTAYRSFKRNKLFSIINILGLAIGIASTILILIWVDEETSYESFNINKEHIFRIITESNEKGEKEISSLHPVPLAPYLKESIPNVSKISRFSPPDESLIEYSNEFFKEVKVIQVDKEFLDLFPYSFIKGPKDAAFIDIFSVVITEELGNRLFGNKDPIGKVVKINKREFTVSGVIENCPTNSHIQFEAITLFDSRSERIKKYIPEDSWDVSAYLVYVQLDNIENLFSEELAITTVLKEVVGDSDKGNIYKLQPISKIHLFNDFEDYIEGHGSIKQVYIFTSIALLILIIACINYVNLSTARYEERSKEVGVRKACGANRKSLIIQFFTESFLNTLLSVVIALVIVEFARPFLNSMTGKELIINYMDLRFWSVLLILIVFTSLISGSYPALFLSSFKVVNVFKKNTISFRESKRNVRIRSVLVVFQLITSMSLIIIVLFMFSQFRYIQSKELGYDSKNVICFSNSKLFENNIENIKSDFLIHPAVSFVAQGNSPTNFNYGTYVQKGNNGTEELKMFVLAVDEDYINTYKIELKQGRNFSRDIITDKNDAIIINESAFKMLGIPEAIGHEISYKTPFEGYKKGKIIGVIKDFHTGALYEEILPLILTQESFWRFQISVRYSNSEQTKEVIEHLDGVWKNYNKEYPFDYYFFQDELSDYYKNESRIFKLVTFFTLIAIIISLLGILGLTYFTTGAYSKEIGIKKVLGAKLTNLVIWLMRDISIKTLLALFISFPIAYYFMKSWIANFAYHTKITAPYFIVGLLITYTLISLIMLIQVTKISKLNPVESLRYE